MNEDVTLDFAYVVVAVGLFIIIFFMGCSVENPNTIWSDVYVPPINKEKKYVP